MLVYLGQHDLVLNLLHSLRQHQLAARYLEACVEVGALKPAINTQSGAIGGNSKLHSQVYTEMTRVLIGLGHRDSAVYYASLVTGADPPSSPIQDEGEFMLN